MPRQRRYYDPGKNPAPRALPEGGTELSAHQAVETRQARRAREREESKQQRHTQRMEAHGAQHSDRDMSTALVPETPEMAAKRAEIGEADSDERRAWAKAMIDKGLTWSELSRLFNQYMRTRTDGVAREYAGIPIPIEGLKLVIEEKYPYKSLEEMFNADKRDDATKAADEAEDRKFTVRNWWISRRLRKEIFIADNAETGRVECYTMPYNAEQRRLLFHMGTFAASWAWSVEAEYKAQEQLCELVGEDKFRYYLFTGTFLERSPRSQITYMFRRGRPTLALGRSALKEMQLLDELGAGAEAGNPRRRVIAALCLHPIAYYSGSFAGAMTPTDEVVAHLMLMRGDEPLYWRRSNQHPYYAAEAGL